MAYSLWATGFDGSQRGPYMSFHVHARGHTKWSVYSARIKQYRRRRRSLGTLQNPYVPRTNIAAFGRELSSSTRWRQEEEEERERYAQLRTWPLPLNAILKHWHSSLPPSFPNGFPCPNTFVHSSHLTRSLDPTLPNHVIQPPSLNFYIFFSIWTAQPLLMDTWVLVLGLVPWKWRICW